MDPSYLKDLLCRGREVEFEYYAKRYVVSRVEYPSMYEYAFGPKWGTKYTSKYFEDILYRNYFGDTLSTMLGRLDRSRFYVC